MTKLNLRDWRNAMQGIEKLEARTLMSGTPFSGPIIDPRQFGARYDGHTDDSAAIQAAVDSLPSTGGTVLINGFSALASGFHLIGRTNVRITAAAPGDGFNITGVPSYPGNYLQYGQFGNATVAISHCYGCEVDSLTVSANGMGVVPIGVAFSGKVYVLNNVITNAGFTAAVFAVGNTGDAYNGNTISGSTNGARGLWIGNCHAGESETYPIISNNNISDISATGIGTMSYGATISGNTVLRCSGAGVALAAGGVNVTRNAVVTSNVLDYNAYQGIQADSWSDSMQVSNVVITNNACVGNGHAGIYVVRATGWTITGNTCSNNVDAGIYIERAHNVTATSNTCSDTRSGSARTQQIGISVNSQVVGQSTDYIAICKNHLANNENSGLFICALAGCTTSQIQVTGNGIDGNGIYGILVTPNGDGTITNLTLGTITLSPTSVINQILN